MKRIYTEVPIFENDNFMLRKVSKDDAEDLLKVYSDTKSLPFLILIIVMVIFFTTIP